MNNGEKDVEVQVYIGTDFYKRKEISNNVYSQTQALMPYMSAWCFNLEQQLGKNATKFYET
jgi:hypothetical protein